MRTAWRRRCERTLVCAGVLLPIPLFAASGLSLPLPASVERLAAALVPWAEAATNGNELLARGPGGSIVRLGGEQSEGISYALGGESAPAGEKQRAEGDRNAPGENGGTDRKTPGENTPADSVDREEGKPADGGGAGDQPATQEPVQTEPVRDEPVRGNDLTPPPPPPPAPPPPTPPPPPPPADPVAGAGELVDRTTAPIREIVPIIPPVTPLLPPPPPILPNLPGLGR
ncbi:MAG: hypothetical protein ACRDKK_06940 [Gaiellaceae bacterium]